MSRGGGASRREGTREGDVEKELRRGWGVERVMGKDEEKKKQPEKPRRLGLPVSGNAHPCENPETPFPGNP